MKNIDATPADNWHELYTPIENSTQLNVTKGEKLEARIEGGGAEDVKYKRGTFGLAFNIRKGKVPGASTARRLPFSSVDGYVNDQFAVLLQPEDPTCEGFLIERGTVTIDESYSSTDGGVWQIQIDAVKPASGDTIKWGEVETVENTKKISFTEGSSYDSPAGEVQKTITNETFAPVESSEVSS